MHGSCAKKWSKIVRTEVDVVAENADAARRDIYPKGKRVTATAPPRAGAVLSSGALSFPKMTRK
jgi:hypothetical protein